MYSTSKLLSGRYSADNHFYSITICCENRAALFENFENACIAASSILRMQNKVNNICYTLMPDHLHWLFQLKDASLSDVIKHYKGMTTVGLNQHNRTSGKVWQKNYFEHHIKAQSDLLNQARYIVANPLRAGLVSKIEHYPFWDCVYI